MVDAHVKSRSDFDGALHGALVQHRSGAGKAQAHGTGTCVGLSAVGIFTAAEGLGLCG